MTIVAIVVTALLVGAIWLLVRFLARRSTRADRRTVWLAGVLAPCTLIAVLGSSYASIYYRPPSWLLAVLVIVWAGVIAVAVIVAVDERWRPLPLLAIAGLFVSGVVASALLMMGVPDLGRLFPFETAARQIGEASGFAAWLPTQARMNLGSKPVGPLEDPEKGLWVDYEGFRLEERPAGINDLDTLVAEGAVPVIGAPPIPSGASSSVPRVFGFSAHAVSYAVPPKGGENVSGRPQRSPTVAFLVFEKEGTEIRLYSEGYQRREGDQWVTQSALSVDELVRIAESMQPAR